MSKIAFIFPGQGSQEVGMAQNVFEQHEKASSVIKKADERLEYSLSGYMFNGPKEVLKKTEHAQPALLTASAALLETVKEKDLSPDFVAGHSLGEYSALVAAGVLSFDDAVYAVRQRGLFMEEAVPDGVGAMAAIMGLERPELERVCAEASAEGETAELANLNAPGQIVISGSRKGVETASDLAKEAGAKRAIPLEVSGPFHSTLMEPAKDKLREVLSDISFQDAGVPVMTNVTALPETNGETLRDLLVDQVTSPVLWEDTIKNLIERDVTTFIEIGSGNVLSGLVRRIQRRGLEVHAVNDLESLEKTLKKLKEE
ncbi:ACP S-malonyltransferase [Thalassorhabdus alkalitolerans]|uniref:Malonyl CoA-acyl carrier protein transacylase n=1 Tax=Thalassorhabdus alkalitolerans TaxID=2282697 RepID=A0ABW0YNY3_9BACI